ncbi:glycosyltransferase family 2 protein [Beijerinckia indica]|uniref:Glycosyl transferase family 2 n=1 Tax=Beijerinckia indica subsp. indica (strain ATCC 9039 / DSM 1715 / NCIMB 8712) TaxID=395963 RepID=B2IEX9_BEII9|nr:glycosyltransferase family 2 protein [Beijerinckia indica]ACB94170.1 glycosyl transferase family 2 [Beijerinckia indica subsp. indica ATCC 9039]
MIPEISAILTTHNRAHLLPRVLQGLKQQTLAPSRFEIVAIDDGSTDDTQAVLKHWQNELPLRIFPQRASGLAAAKNLGIFVSRAPIVVFLDDDDVASPDLLASHLAIHLEQPDQAVAVLGRTILAPEIADLPLMRHVTEVGCQLFSYHWMQPRQVLGYKEFWGGRSSCKRGLLVRHGVFHPDFKFGCEDIELGWRLAKHGLRVIYEPRAYSTMIRAINFDQFCQRSYRQGRSQHAFSMLHDDNTIRAYCEIDAALAAWHTHWVDYAGLLRWTRKLEKLTLARARASFPLHDLLQKTLDLAYRDAFFLSRAKGIADTAKETTKPVDQEKQRDLFEYGLQAAR